jgi:hypothetical protein
MAYRVELPCGFTGKCRYSAVKIVGVFLRDWVADFGMFGVLAMNRLAQSFALDSAMQLLDWARNAGHEVDHYALSPSEKADISSALSELVVRFVVPEGHKFVHREVTQVQPWKERVVQTLPGQSGLAVLQRCHLSKMKFSVQPIEGWAETLEGERMDANGFAFICDILYKQGEGVYSCPGLLPATWITATRRERTGEWQDMPVDWSAVIELKNRLVKKARRSRRVSSPWLSQPPG